MTRTILLLLLLAGCEGRTDIAAAVDGGVGGGSSSTASASTTTPTTAACPFGAPCSATVVHPHDGGTEVCAGTCDAVGVCAGFLYTCDGAACGCVPPG